MAVCPHLRGQHATLDDLLIHAEKPEKIAGK